LSSDADHDAALLAAVVEQRHGQWGHDHDHGHWSDDHDNRVTTTTTPSGPGRLFANKVHSDAIIGRTVRLA